MVLPKDLKLPTYRGGMSNSDRRGVSPYLKQLLRIMIGTFYTLPDREIIDLLIHAEVGDGCLTESELDNTLKIGIRLLRTRLQTLETHKIIRIRKAGDTPFLFGVSKTGGIYIDFNAVRNIIVNKLSAMRTKVEEAESGSLSTITNFICTLCSKKFNELYVHEIYVKASDSFVCTLCRGEVKEVERPKSTLTMEKFNKSFNIFYKLLKLADEDKTCRIAEKVKEEEQEKKKRKLKNGDESEKFVFKFGRLSTSGPPILKSAHSTTKSDESSNVEKSRSEMRVVFLTDEEMEAIERGKNPTPKEKPIWLQTDCTLSDFRNRYK